MKRSEKIDYVDDLRTILSDATIAVAARQGGLTVGQMTALRSAMRQAGGSVKVLKNTLAIRAVQGSKFEAMSDSFVGPIVLGFSKDPVAAAKVFVEFAAANDRMDVIAGNLNGQTLTKDRVESLAKLPSLDELRATLLGIIVAPATKIARILQVPGSQVARVLAAHAEKNS